MFPMASPNPLFGNLASGGQTPSAIDFHRTAMSAAAASRSKDMTSVPVGFDGLGLSGSLEAQGTTATSKMGDKQMDPYGHVDANDAANGLFMLAQAKHGSANPNQMSKSSSSKATDMGDKLGSMGVHGQDLSALSPKDGEDGSDSGKSEPKPNTRSRGKKTPAKKQTNGRRKADAPPSGSKGPSAKRSRASSSMAMDDDDDDDGMDIEEEPEHMVNGKDTRKMTDEEKRKNFLERNRVAALKCRQRKKQWLANLQTKVEVYTTENDQLQQQLQHLRNEVVSLKTILLAHKDCPVTQSQGLTDMNMGMNAFGQNPYNMGMAGRGQAVTGQRRFS